MFAHGPMELKATQYYELYDMFLHSTREQRSWGWILTLSEYKHVYGLTLNW